MFVSGLGTANPPKRYTKAECWQAFADSGSFGQLNPRARRVLDNVLHQDNGIHTRHLALDALADAFDIDPDTLHRRFLAQAPALAGEAAQRALADAGLAPGDIDAVVVSTCTGIGNGFPPGAFHCSNRPSASRVATSSGRSAE